MICGGDNVDDTWFNFGLTQIKCVYNRCILTLRRKSLKDYLRNKNILIISDKPWKMRNLSLNDQHFQTVIIVNGNY